MAGTIFRDLEKAFDSVNQDLLLSEQPYCAINGKAELLLVSYLQSRYQRFQIINSCLNSNTLSKWTKIKYGVLQGSIWAMGNDTEKVCFIQCKLFISYKTQNYSSLFSKHFVK